MGILRDTSNDSYYKWLNAVHTILAINFTQIGVKRICLGVKRKGSIMFILSYEAMPMWDGMIN